ncbi:MAG: DUF1232 domain-containing protein [Acidimicrobiia bacterium]|nr:DUF1232 domain-containing protein [Acidimicrobiia bacterium]
MGLPDDWSTPLVVLALVGIVAMLAVTVIVLIRFLRTFKLVRSQLMPLGGKVAFWGTLIYVISPIDILPDPLLIDDLALLLGALTYINRLARGLGIDPASEPARGPADSTRRPRSSDDIIDIP